MLDFAAAKPGDTLILPGDCGSILLPSRWGGVKGLPVTIDLGGHTVTGGVKGLGTKWVTLRNGRIRGGKNGVQFSQSGSDHAHTCAGLIITELDIADCLEDGVKVSQADGVEVSHNVIANCGQQCIDLLDVTGFVVTHNDLTGSHVAADISLKGGCRPPPYGKAEVSYNTIHGQRGRTVAAIELGGMGDLSAYGAMLDTRQALARGPACYGVSVLHNTTTDMDGPSLVFMGAVSCSAAANTFARAQLAAAEIMINPDNRGVRSASLTIKASGARVSLDRAGQDTARDKIAVTS